MLGDFGAVIRPGMMAHYNPMSHLGSAIPVPSYFRANSLLFRPEELKFYTKNKKRNIFAMRLQLLQSIPNF
jgi:hypothetical protein